MIDRNINFKEIDEFGNVHYRCLDTSMLNLCELVELRKTLSSYGEEAVCKLDSIIYDEINYQNSFTRTKDMKNHNKSCKLKKKINSRKR